MKPERSPRVSLHLIVEQALLERWESIIASLPKEIKRQARRGLSKAFIVYLTEHDLKRVSYTPKNPVGQRLDLRLPQEIYAKAATLKRLHPFESDSQVLSRYLSGHYAAFLEAELSKH